MNLTTYLLQDIDRLMQAGMDVPILKALKTNLVGAHKYVVPPPRAVRTKITEQSVRFIRPMFPEILFEYEVPDSRKDSAMLPADVQADLGASTKRVTLVIDLKRSDSVIAEAIRKDLRRSQNADEALQAELAVVGFYYMEHGNKQTWLPATGYATWSSQWPAPGMMIDGVSQKLTYGISPLFPGMLSMIMESGRAKVSDEEIMRNDIHEDLAHVIRMMALINARNIKTVKVVQLSSLLISYPVRYSQVSQWY